MIPETAEIEGTIRAVSEKTRAKVHDGIRRVVDGIAAAHGCEVEVEIEQGYPVTVNDADFADVVARRRRAGRRRRQGRAPAAPGDGRRGLELRPAAGARGDDVPRRHARSTATLATAAPNHSNRVVFDEQAMVDGIATYSAVALHHLT